MKNVRQMVSEKNISIHEVASFLLKYACAQLGAGGQTLRVSRTVGRLADSFGCECHATFLSRHVTMTVARADYLPVTLVGTVPHTSLNFRKLVALNNLSWQAHDNGLDCKEVENRYHDIMGCASYNFFILLFGASVANSAFCRLFGGDFAAMALVFFATFIAMSFRKYLERYDAAPCLSFMLTSFLASLLVAVSTLSGMTSTPQVAIGSSVLFLIPGVPMINSTLDLLTGFPLMAFSRLVRSGMLVCSIGIGLGSTLFFTGLEMGSIVHAYDNKDLWTALGLDGAFAALACMGFALLSNPGIFVILISGFFAAIGHAFRLYLMQVIGLGIIPSSLFAAFIIGVACAMISRRVHIPGEFFSFLALLPMIPGMFAYGTILATIHFMMTESAQDSLPYLITLTKDFFAVMFIMCAMSIGAILPLLAQRLFINRIKS